MTALELGARLADRRGLEQLPPAWAAHAVHVFDCLDAGIKPTQAPPPVYATRRDPGNVSLGGSVLRASIALGEPLMPWQASVAMTSHELDPYRPGAWRYPVVIVTVPRQSGKTTLMRAVRVARATARAHQVILMTAQTGKDAKKQWNKMVARAQRDTSPLAPFAHVRKSQGSEALTFPNGSAISPFAPTPKSVHGDTTHLWDVDEAWAFGAEEGGALLDALDPTQITVIDGQAWIFSTMGTAISEWWNAYVDAGRLAVGDPQARVAYFEWSMPEGADPFAPATIASFHPAVGHTQELAKLMEKSSGSAAVWRRGYLNLRSEAGGGSVVDAEEWAALAADHPRPAGSNLVIGYAVADDRSGASIYAAWVTGEDSTHVQLVATNPGAAWLPNALKQLQDALAPRAIVADDYGHTRNATAEAQRLGVQVRVLTGREYSAACTDYLGRVADERISHDGSHELADALAVAALRPMAGGRGFDARHSAGPIDALQAPVQAQWAAASDTTPTIQLF